MSERMNILKTLILLATVVLCVSITACIEKPAPPPPLPPPEITGRIADAKKVFVSNVGEDSIAAANLPGGADACYNTFYASLKQWGHYELVGSPKDADLVFEISATKKHWDYDPGIVGIASPPTTRGVRLYPAIITLTVEDNLTISTLWTTHVEYLSGAIKEKSKVREFDERIETLTDRLKAMAAAPDPMKSP